MLFRNSDLKVRPVRTIENKRIQAVTWEHVCKHTARVNEAVKRYNIHDPARVFNLDETSISLKTICRRAVQKGTGRANTLLYRVDVSAKGGIEEVAVMGF